MFYVHFQMEDTIFTAHRVEETNEETQERVAYWKAASADTFNNGVENVKLTDEQMAAVLFLAFNNDQECEMTTEMYKRIEGVFSVNSPVP